MFYYYSRISSASQNASRQIENFKAHGHLKADNVFIDKISGNIPFAERPEASKLIDIITSAENQNITVVIDSVDRIGRNLINILETIQFFTRNNINIKSLKEGFETLLDGKPNPIANIVISTMGSIAELERNRIKERQKEGILIARAKGRFKGRKVGSVQSKDRLLERYPVVIQKLKKGIAVRDISEITGNSTATIMKVKKALGLAQTSDN